MSEQASLIVAMPTRGSISIETHLALLQNMDGLRWALTTAERKPVAEARNSLTGTILQAGFDFALLVDDDAWWPAGTVQRMVATMQARPELDLLAGFFGGRVPFSEPAAWVDDASTVPVSGTGLLPAVQIGAHFVLTRVSALVKAGPEPFTPGGSDHEDTAFCRRLRAAGGKLFVDTSAVVAHVDVRTGFAFVPGARPGRVLDNRLVRATEFDGLTDEEVARRFAADFEVREYGPGVTATKPTPIGESKYTFQAAAV